MPLKWQGLLVEQMVCHCSESEYFSSPLAVRASTGRWGRSRPHASWVIYGGVARGRTVERSLGGRKPRRELRRAGCLYRRYSVAIVRRLFEAFDAVDLAAMGELLSWT